MTQEKPDVKRIKRKSQGRPRNKVLTYKDRSGKNKKKRAVDENYKKVKIIKTGRRGRPAFVLPFEEARALVHAEQLSSRNAFIRWWNINIPARIPKNPSRTYANDWKGWGDFLNSYNEYPEQRPHYRSFHEAREYARALMLKTKDDWVRHVNSGKLPIDIPKWPNMVYGRTIYTEKPKRGGYWVSWKDWVGSTFIDKLTAANSKIDVLVISQMSHFPPYVYAFIMYKDLPIDIIRRIKEEKVVVLKAYQINSNFDWGLWISNNFNSYYNMTGLYSIPNIHQVYYKFDMEMNKFDC